MSDFPDLMYPTAYGGTIVRRLLASAADAEINGDNALATVLFNRAMTIDNNR